MNPKIQIFLENYTCEQVRPNYWVGDYKKRPTLHRLRDKLTDADWIDIRDFACTGFHDMPINLRNSAHQKFDAFEQWATDNGVYQYTFTEIMYAAMDTPHQREAQTLIWGVITTCIEAGYWGMQDV